jgi:hypothetical protein
MEDVMNIRYAFAVIAVLAATPALAEEDLVRTLSEQSGLSERKVRMLLGNRSAYAEYPYTHQRSVEQLEKAIGKDNYQRLISGQRIEMPKKEVEKTAIAKVGEDD